MEINSTNNKNVDELLKIVSGKLGVPPEKLRSELAQGKFDSALKSMKPEDAAKFNQVLANPKLIEKLMSAPQAQALYKKLGGKM
ncbi:MAG: hypothetical protein ACI4JJ_01510 [Huintestinicola sp.]